MAPRHISSQYPPVTRERKSVVGYDKRQNKADNILPGPDKKVTGLDRNCSK